MTTTVTVKTHAWPVEVRTFPLRDRQPIEGAEWSEPDLVPANSEGHFYISDSQDIMVRELPQEGN